MMIMQISPQWVQPGVAARREERETYSVCPNCGFRLLEIIYPNQAAHASPVAYCPICGYRRSDTGVAEGRAMASEEKLAALRGWLAVHDLNEALLQKNYHLSPKDFFVEGAL